MMEWKLSELERVRNAAIIKEQQLRALKAHSDDEQSEQSEHTQRAAKGRKHGH